jgi:hypothetical protein
LRESSNSGIAIRNSSTPPLVSQVLQAGTDGICVERLAVDCQKVSAGKTGDAQEIRPAARMP